MVEGVLSESLFVFGGSQEEDQQNTSFAGRLFGVAVLFVYEICYAVGYITLRTLRRLEWSVLDLETRAQRAFERKVARSKTSLQRWFRHAFDPFLQLFTVLPYVRLARAPWKGSARIPLITVGRIVAGKIFRSLWWLIVSVLNIAAPIAGIYLLALCVQYFTDYQYGLEVTFNGEPIGWVASEAQAEEARRIMLERMEGVGFQGAEDMTLTLSPAAEGITFTDTNLMADRMIRYSGADLFDGVGLYMDGDFIGALTDGNALLEDLAERLDSARTGAEEETVSFNHRFSIRQGLFPVSSRTSVQELSDRFDGNITEEKRYTVVAGDTPSGIASRYGIRTNDLVSLNPGILTDLYPGDSLLIANSVPFLRIYSTRKVVSEEQIAYPTERETDNEKLMGTYEVTEEGEPGIREVVSRVTYLDDEIVEQEVLSRRVLQEPVPRKIVVGGRKPAVSATQRSTAQATPAIVNDILSTAGNETFIWPVDGGAITMPIWGYYGHTGNDITGISAGTPIRAAASGVVTYAGATAGGYGRHIIVTHPNGVQTLYAHNSANYVQVGDEVVQGQVIAAVGQTGNAYGNHCHFEIRSNGSYLDARQYIGSRSPR